MVTIFMETTEVDGYKYLSFSAHVLIHGIAESLETVIVEHGPVDDGMGKDIDGLVILLKPRPHCFPDFFERE